MKKTFYLLIFLTATALLLLIININEKNSIQKKGQIYDNISKILSTAIDNEKTQFLSLSIALSNSRLVQDTLLAKNQTIRHNILPESIKSFEKHLGREIYAQILTKDFYAYTRSWDSYLPGVAFQLKRPDLEEVLLTKKAKTGIESGIPPGIKAAAPIIFGNDLLGILEVTTPYDTIVSKLREYQIELVPLIYSNLLSPAYIKHRDLQTLNNSLVITNKNANMLLQKELKSLSQDEFNTLQQNDFIQRGHFYFASYPILNSRGKKLGYFIAIVSERNFENFIGRDKSILKSIFTMGSTKEDIYEFAKYNSENIFMDMGKGYIINSRNSVEDKDRLAYDQAAREKLNKLTKEELIDLILQRPEKKMIRGEIR